MLVDLTPDLKEQERRKIIAEDNNFKYLNQDDPVLKIETGIYQCNFDFNFSDDEFIEKLKTRPILFPKYAKSSYGVADTIEQIKEYYKKELNLKTRKFTIDVTPVWQQRENKGKGGGWRWHKWGKYIGELNPQHEHLDDEDFGEDFKYIIVFRLNEVIK